MPTVIPDLARLLALSHDLARSMADELTGAQRASLEQLTQITNGADPEHERAILESVGWDVAVSIHCLLVVLAARLIHAIAESCRGHI